MTFLQDFLGADAERYSRVEPEGIVPIVKHMAAAIGRLECPVCR